MLRERIHRRFPAYAWAWPRGALHQLLEAAISPDLERAQSKVEAWLNSNDLEQAGFREQRLLAAITTRLESMLADNEAYPRLLGYQKSLWTRSHMALGETSPSLRSLHEAGIPVMLIKGASAIASGTTPRRGRFATDIDILVRPEHMEKAFQRLGDEGWRPFSGQSIPYVRKHIAARRAINLARGRFGDIDLHQSAFDWSQNAPGEEKKLWERSGVADYAGVDIHVPSAADRVAISIGHGALDGYANADWLVDTAATITAGDVDWSILQSVAAARRLSAPMAVVTSYLSNLGIAVPHEVIDRLQAQDAGTTIDRWVHLLQMKPRDDFGKAGPFARGTAKWIRMREARRAGPQTSERILQGRRAFREGQSTTAAFARSHRIALPARQTGDGELRLKVRVQAPDVPRRIEMEVNDGERHVSRLRYRSLMRLKNPIVLTFRGTIPLRNTATLTIEARPSRVMRGKVSPDLQARYAPLPFQILNAEVLAEPTS